MKFVRNIWYAGSWADAVTPETLLYRKIINTPGTIPAAMKVPTYPVVEKDTMLWVWMGDQPADESLIPDFSVMNEGDVRKPIAEADQEFEAEIANLHLHAFQEQDESLMEAMQEMLGIDELLRRPPVLFNVDTGPVRMKRVLEELLAKETPAAGEL